jgi:nitrogen fixation-related uncharacterized protein
MELFFNIMIPVSVGAVAIALGFGIYSLYRGGDFARSNSNKLMRLRVALQAVAIVLLLAGLWWKTTYAG